ncbi:DNA topoisomerase III [Ferrimonas lipolytica]|uniref:DNA topoisomerase 3 n=1 Tax=Ferrimonas lipolytica TaxID=2724191 RepID=A0A6H1UDR7_9GAMM|nr:DNA topoisomerase III [Ferrimonas lipolytica]QIZ76769.1 DNA topoisomerase III [Ferrimonas lipolytica]
MNRLIIAEKPSLGRAIAAVLAKPHKNQNGYIEVGNGDCVTWCVGHLLEQLQPDEYDQRFKQWRLQDLPIEIEQWQLKPRQGMSKQISVVRKLLKNAKQIVHAGDPDREGQLLVDELLDYLKLSKTRKQQVQRLLISDLNPSAVTKALGQLKPNSDFVALSISALARSRADWLYGMNMSRAYTLLGQQAGYGGVLSVGRVQTPVLGLVVRRDQQIAQFVAKPFYQLDAIIPHDGNTIRARWQPSDACEQWVDEDGRLLARKLAEHVAGRIAQQPALVSSAVHKQTKQTAPLPYSLSALQIDASKRFGLSAQQVLSAAQKLYEQHKLITYPRSDCRYLPKGHLGDVSKIMTAISTNDDFLQDAVSGADQSLRSRCWNDGKVTAHHAIIPTPKAAGSSRLGIDEAKVYQLIARQYLIQFYPPAQYSEGELKFEIAGGLFVAKGKQLLKPGWKALLPTPKDKVPDYLPKLSQGEVLTCAEGQIKDCMTEPPKAFTEATLLQAMTGIARFVKDSSLKNILRETDGLGTEATRAGIIELLFKRSFLQRRGKAINATAAGTALITALPESASYPDMTAQWEHQLQRMAERQMPYQPFMVGLSSSINDIITRVKSEPAPACLAGLPAVAKRRFKSKSTKRSSAKTAPKRISKSAS